jgi:hypothetical protein
MNCNDVSEFLDRMIFEEVSAGDDLVKHIDACPDCSREYLDALKARAAVAMARGNNPELIAPIDLTDDIMQAVDRESGKTAVLSVYLAKLLAAASIALCMVFGYEQFEVVRKVSALEIQFSQAGSGFQYTGPARLAASLDIRNSGISLSKVEKVLAAGTGTRLASFMDIQKRFINRKQK